MSVTNSLNILAHLIKEKMHASFGGNLAIAMKVATIQIHDDEVAGGHHAFVQARGSGENPIVIETNGEIALPGNNVATLVEPAAHKANIMTVLFLSARSEIAR
jgi:hypothetical protein